MQSTPNRAGRIRNTPRSVSINIYQKFQISRRFEAGCVGFYRGILLFQHILKPFPQLRRQRARQGVTVMQCRFFPVPTQSFRFSAKEVQFPRQWRNLFRTARRKLLCRLRRMSPAQQAQTCVVMHQGTVDSRDFQFPPRQCQRRVELPHSDQPRQQIDRRRLVTAAPPDSPRQFPRLQNRYCAEMSRSPAPDLLRTPPPALPCR